MTSTTLTAATAAATIWNLDAAHSVAEFKVRHMMVSYVKGKFSGLSGVLKLDDADYTHSTGEVSIPADSVSTVDDNLDAHYLKARHPDEFRRIVTTETADLSALTEPQIEEFARRHANLAGAFDAKASI